MQWTEKKQENSGKNRSSDTCPHKNINIDTRQPPTRVLFSNLVDTPCQEMNRRISTAGHKPQT